MYHGTPVWRRGGAGIAAAAMAAMQRLGHDQGLAWSGDCPAPFRDLVLACLSRDPQARPTFAHIVHALMDMQRGLQQQRRSLEQLSPALLPAPGQAQGARLEPERPQGQGQDQGQPGSGSGSTPGFVGSATLESSSGEAGLSRGRGPPHRGSCEAASGEGGSGQLSLAALQVLEYSSHSQAQPVPVPLSRADSGLPKADSHHGSFDALRPLPPALVDMTVDGEELQHQPSSGQWPGPAAAMQLNEATAAQLTV